MLKYLIFITAITLFESCDDSRVQAAFPYFGSPKSDEDLYQCSVKLSAEKKFIAEEDAKKKKIEDLKQDLQNTKDKLDVGKTANTWMPRKTWKPWTQAWHYLKKVFQTVGDLKNIFLRDWVKTPRLKKELKKMKSEALFDNRLSGLEICQHAFQHKFFTSLKKWNLVTTHSKTKARKKLWIRVQTPHNEIEVEYEAKEKKKAERRSKLAENIVLKEENEPEVERNKFWRQAKLCMAVKKEHDPNKPFEVYISAAFGYNKDHPNTYIFVFSTTPGKLQDWIDRWVFWWHRVVYVEGYLW